MVRMRPERYAPGSATKLHTRSANLFRVLSWIGENAYVVNIPPLWGISSTFNVADLVSHQAPPLSSNIEPSSIGPFSEREFAMEDGVLQRFLVCWQGCPLEDNAWISEVDLERLQPDLLEPLPSLLANSSESSSFDPKRIDSERDLSPSAQETSAV
ncbi:unnamed protein product [Spirodela intermedia]|uniref:Tf2-1-like SH3-like domain-containing protein n=1 Tax=Spirodela intermedia TaxID=51605 RepID=A0ABN7E967_SPIIN|nr:unnamed protein product [Spirodela intermedia]